MPTRSHALPKVLALASSILFATGYILYQAGCITLPGRAEKPGAPAAQPAGASVAASPATAPATVLLPGSKAPATLIHQPPAERPRTILPGPKSLAPPITVFPTDAAPRPPEPTVN